jgi:hypothetical protein
MNVDRTILAGAATVQFGTLALSGTHQQAIGFMLGMLSGAILLLLAFGVYPARRGEPTRNDEMTGATADR